MTTFADVGRAIAQNIALFRKPGILLVRPGYHTQQGWPVGEPLIVALVGALKGDAGAYGIPQRVGGFAVEIREASALERMKATRPDSYEAFRARTRPEYHAASFPFEHSMIAAPIAAVAAAAHPAKPQIEYQPPPVALNPVTGTLTVICCASPDAGWPTLSNFFRRISQKLVVGMYDFTSAHVLAALQTALTANAPPDALSIVLDHPARNPTADQTDEETHQSLANALGDGMSFAWAPVRSSPEVSEWIFPSAYHIKVAVRDSEETWLSSGNWNNSNQPEDAPATEADPLRAAKVFKASDRDWHIVVASPELAATFEAYLLNDQQTAVPAQQVAAGMAAGDTIEAFAEQGSELAEVNESAGAGDSPRYFAPVTFTEPMTLQPLLTPDLTGDGTTGMYASAMLALISGAQQSLYIQLQYIHPSNKEEDAAFTALLNAVAARSAERVDVRIILSQWQNSQWMERLQGAGIDTSLVRIQNGVHNKGFVVDHRFVVISSQNWSSDGVLRNRDAGLIVDNEKVARYFEEIFLNDWDHVAAGRGGSRGMVAAVAADLNILGWQDDPGETVPPAVPPEARAVPNLTLAPLQLVISGAGSPAPQAYDSGSSEFRYWAAAEAAARGAAFWRPILPAGTNWQVGDTLNLLLDEGEDFNAYYNRQALNFFHGTAGGRTVYSGESPDVVCHEQGHAILDAIRAELFDAGTIEAAAFHESFGDMAAILAALQLPTLRAAVFAETDGDLSRTSRLSRLAEQLGWAIRQSHPSAVEADCLRNAANSFFYANPENLPPSAPATTLSSEPHSFSRVFTGAFLESLAGGLRLAVVPGPDELEQVSRDLARLLVAGVLAAPIVPEYMSQVAAAMITADAAVTGKYGDVLKSAFVRHGILSPQSVVGLASFHATSIASMDASAAPAHRELPHIGLSASEYGLGDRPLLVRAAADPRRFGVAAAAYGVGFLTPSNSEHAARAFVEDLLQRGHVDVSCAGHSTGRVVHPHSFKTHRLVPRAEGLELTRILFDCGFRTT